MKDSLIEMLLNLFEKTLTQLKEKHESQVASSRDIDGQTAHAELSDEKQKSELAHVKTQSPFSMRIFTADEQLKLTKASYQFLMRMLCWGVIAPEALELVINRLIFSESRFVALQETKWTIRNTLADSLNAEQLAFLDLVLYQKEDGLALH